MSDVQTSLGKADSAYQKPSTGIPKTDLASAVQTSLGKADTAVQPADLNSYVDDGDYDSTTHYIRLKHGDEVVASIDASAFIVDGMVEDVRIENGNLIIDFNTESGKQDISIPLTDIFNPNNYYDKTATNTLLDAKEDKTNKVTTLSSSSTDTQYPSAKVVYTEVNKKEDKTNKVTSLSSSSTDTQYPSAKVVYTEVNKKEDKTNKVTSISSSSTDVQYPSAKCVYDSISTKNTTYSALKTLRDNSQLVPGGWYRITDYVTTTVGDDSDSLDFKSANHAFDIIVRADEVNKLNENAYAAVHSGDTYFTNCKLEAWELKYRIDNDTNRFIWINPTTAKGVIYYMKDEFGNECPYDFKNIMFKRYKITQFDKSSSLVNTYSGIRNESVNIPYDSTLDLNNPIYRYTFDYLNGTTSNDLTVYQYTQSSIVCYNNIINEYYSSKQLNFNNIVIGGTSYNNCYNNTFGNNCRFNTFGYNCYSNTFGDGSQSNTFGNSCYSNLFGNSCTSNSFGNYCYYNSFGNYCDDNSFGSGCVSNSFGNYCGGNSFWDECYSNSFGNRCYSNSFGTYCSYNSFWNYCQYNKFGNSSTLKSYCKYIIVENGNRYLYINCSATTSSSA